MKNFIVVGAVFVGVVSVLYVLQALFWTADSVPPVTNQSADTNPEYTFPDVVSPEPITPGTDWVSAYRTAFQGLSPQEFMSLSPSGGRITLMAIEESLPVVPLSQWLVSIGATIPSPLLSLLKDDRWVVYKCAASERLVFSTHTKLLPNYSGNLFADQVLYLKNWEETLVDDLSPVLFPNLSTTQKLLKLTPFVDGARNEVMRYSTVRLPDGTNVKVGYMLIGDELLFGTDRQCIFEVQDQFFDLRA